MLSNLNWSEILILALLAMFIFGPERLPKLLGEAIKVLRTVRTMARNATNDLSKELGTQVTLEDLNPKTFITKHLLSEEDQALLKRPFDDAANEVRKITDEIKRPAPTQPASSRPGTDPVKPESPVSRYDDDAT